MFFLHGGDTTLQTTLLSHPAMDAERATSRDNSTTVYSTVTLTSHHFLTAEKTLLSAALLCHLLCTKAHPATARRVATNSLYGSPVL